VLKSIPALALVDANTVGAINGFKVWMLFTLDVSERQPKSKRTRAKAWYMVSDSLPPVGLVTCRLLADRPAKTAAKWVKGVMP
jgi:hypothetical protein